MIMCTFDVCCDGACMCGAYSWLYVDVDVTPFSPITLSKPLFIVTKYTSDFDKNGLQDLFISGTTGTERVCEIWLRFFDGNYVYVQSVETCTQQSLVSLMAPLLLVSESSTFKRASGLEAKAIR